MVLLGPRDAAMADGAGAPRPGFRPLTDGEKAVQSMQGTALFGDLKVIAKVNPTQPFTTLQDAAQHLLPFHVSGRPGRPEAGAASRKRRARGGGRGH